MRRVVEFDRETFESGVVASARNFLVATGKRGYLGRTEHARLAVDSNEGEDASVGALSSGVGQQGSAQNCAALHREWKVVFRPPAVD